MGIALVGFWIAVAVVLHGRETERSTACQHRQVELGRLLTSDLQGRLPWLVEGESNWVRQALATTERDLTNPDQHLSELLCPADAARIANAANAASETANTLPGGLSFVANGGFGMFNVEADGIVEQGTHSAEQDLDGDGTVSAVERDIARSTGVFWRPGGGTDPTTLEWITQRDGLDATLMLSENIDARRWSSKETADLAFVIGRGQLQFASDPVGPTALLINPFELGPFKPNAGMGPRPGKSPVPSSWHPGAVNVVYCSGRVQALSDQIDPLVYERLLTPAGTRHGEPGPP